MLLRFFVKILGLVDLVEVSFLVTIIIFFSSIVFMIYLFIIVNFGVFETRLFLLLRLSFVGALI